MKNYIKAVSKDLSPQGCSKFSFVIGREYSSENGYCFCDTANATREYFENPLETRYLEVQPLSEVVSLGDPHSFRANEIKIIREVLLEELRKDFHFNSTCNYYEGLDHEVGGKKRFWKKIFKKE
ncbi:hypothetical protein [Clostridium sp. KNHs214]|uniref:DUF7666 domain-containing protein n=1 Tax=Clostridium sp. KNHs214 TaxID=1540257 RepID=UPI0005564B2E|nr:hypothetical protein [Clostridium sp. KNHs214]